MRIEQLYCFRRVAECQSFSRAAKMMYMTQPAVSKMVDQLEKELRKELVVRSFQGVELTSFGRKVYKDSEEILNIVSSWTEESLNKSNVKDVILQANSSMCSFLSEAYLRGFHKEYPEINLCLCECMSSQDVFRSLISSRSKIGIISVMAYSSESVSFLNDIKEHGWEYRQITMDENVIYAGKNNPILKKEKIQMEDLKNYPLVVSMDPSAAYNYLTWNKYFKFDSNYRGYNKEQILQIVSETNALAIYPFKVSSHEYFIHRRLVVPLKVSDVDLGSSTFYLVYLPEKSMSMEEKIVMNHISGFFANEF